MLWTSQLWQMSTAPVSIMSSLCQTGDAYPEGLCKFNRNILSLQAAWGIKFLSFLSPGLVANMFCLDYNLCARGTFQVCTVRRVNLLRKSIMKMVCFLQNCYNLNQNITQLKIFCFLEKEFNIIQKLYFRSIFLFIVYIFMILKSWKRSNFYMGTF